MTAPDPHHSLTFTYHWVHWGDTVALSMTATYDPGPPEVCELLDATDEWGADRLDELALNLYEDARLTALSLFHDQLGTST